MQSDHTIHKSCSGQWSGRIIKPFLFNFLKTLPHKHTLSETLRGFWLSDSSMVACGTFMREREKEREKYWPLAYMNEATKRKRKNKTIESVQSSNLKPKKSLQNSNTQRKSNKAPHSCPPALKSESSHWDLEACAWASEAKAVCI